MSERPEELGGLRGDLLDAVAARAVSGLSLDVGLVRREVGRRRRRRAALTGGVALVLAAGIFTATRLGGGPIALDPQLPVASEEVCQEYDPATVEAGRSAVTATVDGRRQALVVLPPETPEAARATALALARAHTGHCTIGPAETGLQYWKRGGEAVDDGPAPSAAGVTCTGYDPAALTVTGSGDRWQLVASDVLLATTTSGPDAARALVVARAADLLCVVGDPARPVTWYWIQATG